MTEDLGSIGPVNTFAELGDELKRRRVKAGFPTVDKLVKMQSGSGLARSTAYSLERGKTRPNWSSIEAYLRALGAGDGEVGAWHATYWTLRVHLDSLEESIPSPSQLVEMDVEQAVRTLNGIEATEAADLLQRVAIKDAVALVSSLSPDTGASILPHLSTVRASGIFVRIDCERGAELLAELDTQEAVRMVDELDAGRVASLAAEMPHGRAVRMLSGMSSDRASRVLVKMKVAMAVTLASELGSEVMIRMIHLRDAGPIIESMGIESVLELLAEKMDRGRAMKLLEAAECRVVPKLLTAMGRTRDSS